MFILISNEDPDTLVVTYPSISVCLGLGKMINQSQPDNFHENSVTTLDNYPLLQVDFTMLDKKNSVYNPHDDHRLSINLNDIKGNSTLGTIFHTQSVYLAGSNMHTVMNCMTFDPPTPVESGVEHQVHSQNRQDTSFFNHSCLSRLRLKY